MALVYQRFTHASVNRAGGDVGLRIHFMDSQREDNLSLLLDSSDFTVKEARAETPRNPGGIMGDRDLQGLRGKRMYLKSTQGLREALMGMPKEEREHYFQLLVAGVANLVQAEVFLLPERGFSTPEAYEQFFQGLYEDGCVFYANLDRVQRDFMTYVEANHKGRGQNSLFSRHSTATVRSAPGNERFLVRSNLSDSFHEMAIKLLVDYDKTILASRVSILRIPDPVCGESARQFPEVQGKKLSSGNIRELVGTAAGPRGCAHLGDLLVEGARALEKIL
jgi:hypothetical protein